MYGLSVIALLFIVGFGGAMVWLWGCYACCAMMVTAPIGALSCRRWARRQGLDVARCTRLGALYWATGLMPWVYFAFQMNGRTPPRGRMQAIYAALFCAWLAGPIAAGLFYAGAPGNEPIAWMPKASLLGWIAALVSLRFAKALPARRQRVHVCHLLPSLLGVLAMLTWLPFRWLPLPPP